MGTGNNANTWTDIIWEEFNLKPDNITNLAQEKPTTITPGQENPFVVTTVVDGTALFEGLPNGTYYLQEIKAPDGYNKLTEDVKVVITGGSTTEELTVTKVVINNKGGLLPSTGGTGTTLFYIVGGALAVGALVLLATKRRMDNEED